MCRIDFVPSCESEDDGEDLGNSPLLHFKTEYSNACMASDDEDAGDDEDDEEGEEELGTSGKFLGISFSIVFDLDPSGLTATPFNFRPGLAAQLVSIVPLLPDIYNVVISQIMFSFSCRPRH
jgi:hypothetical protein